MAADKQFADYCCELLSSVGPCMSKRMFGGFGISTDGLTVAIIADLGSGEKLWLKADDATRVQYEAAGCARFTYDVVKNGVGKLMSMNYYSAPEEAMDSMDAMRPWAALAFQCAVRAKALAKPKAKSSAPSPAKLGAPAKASKLSQAVIDAARAAAKSIANRSLPATPRPAPPAVKSKPAVKSATKPQTSTARKSAKS
jgi:DNA transformation protein and related proteins